MNKYLTTVICLLSTAQHQGFVWKYFSSAVEYFIATEGFPQKLGCEGDDGNRFLPNERHDFTKKNSTIFFLFRISFYFIYLLIRLKKTRYRLIFIYSAFNNTNKSRIIKHYY